MSQFPHLRPLLSMWMTDKASVSVEVCNLRVKWLYTLKEKHKNMLKWAQLRTVCWKQRLNMLCSAPLESPGKIKALKKGRIWIFPVSYFIPCRRLMDWAGNQAQTSLCHRKSVKTQTEIKTKNRKGKTPFRHEKKKKHFQVFEDENKRLAMSLWHFAQQLVTQTLHLSL